MSLDFRQIDFLMVSLKAKLNYFSFFQFFNINFNLTKAKKKWFVEFSLKKYYTFIFSILSKLYYHHCERLTLEWIHCNTISTHWTHLTRNKSKNKYYDDEHEHNGSHLFKKNKTFFCTNHWNEMISSPFLYINIKELQKWNIVLQEIQPTTMTILKQM